MFGCVTERQGCSAQPVMQGKKEWTGGRGGLSLRTRPLKWTMMTVFLSSPQKQNIFLSYIFYIFHPRSYCRVETVRIKEVLVLFAFVCSQDMTVKAC